MSLRIINNLINCVNTIDSGKYHHHYSGIYRNGKKMFTGSNSLRNSYNGECICYSTHAEMDVLYKILKQQNTKLFSGRFNSFLVNMFLLNILLAISFFLSLT